MDSNCFPMWQVDAALDLSHTQNIGKMIKTHFPHSQVYTSLKYNMEIVCVLVLLHHEHISMKCSHHFRNVPCVLAASKVKI